MDTKRALLLAVVGSVLVCLMTALGALADQEPNDDLAGAETLPGGTVTGTLTYDVDETDCYKFTVSEGQTIAVTFKASTAGDFLYGSLVDWEEWSILDLESKGDVVASGTWHTSNETEEATWYFCVESDTEGGSYEFTITLTDQDDGGLGKDAGGGMEGADPIEPGTTVTGLLADDDEEDWYRFRAGEGDIISVSLTSDSDADFLYMDLVDWEDYTTFQLESKDSVVAEDSWYTARETTTVYWYLRVHMDTDMGEYDLALQVDHQNDAASQQEAPGDTATALELAPGTYTGHLEDEDEADVYKFQMGEGDYVHVTFSADTAGDFIYLGLVDWEDWGVWSLSSKDSVEDEGSYWTANETEVAWYYLVVEMDTEAGDYHLDFEVARQDDAGEGEDAPAEEAKGRILQAGAIDGWMGDADGADAYRIPVQAGWTVTVNLTNQASVAAEADIIGDTGVGTIQVITSKDGTVATWTGIIEIPTATDGYLYVLVRPGDATKWVPGAYHLEVTVVTTPADTEKPQIVMAKEPTKVEQGKAQTFTVTVTDNEAIDRVSLYFKIDDEVTWREMAMTADGTSWSATVPNNATMDAAKLEYVIVAWDAAGNSQTYGEWTSPKSMKVTEPPEDDPGFGALAAVVVLTILAAGLAGRRGRNE